MVADLFREAIVYAIVSTRVPAAFVSAFLNPLGVGLKMVLCVVMLRSVLTTVTTVAAIKVVV